ADRYPSARALRDALQHVLAGGEIAPARASGAPAAARGAPRPQVARPQPRRSSQGRLVLLGIVAAALAGGAYVVQPWGRTLDAQALRERAATGACREAWLDAGGLGGYLAVGPLVPPFFTTVSESELPAAVFELRSAGVTVDTSWEVRRLHDLAA